MDEEGPLLPALVEISQAVGHVLPPRSLVGRDAEGRKAGLDKGPPAVVLDEVAETLRGGGDVGHIPGCVEAVDNVEDEVIWETLQVGRC